MGKVKQAYMSKTMDDMGADEHPDWKIPDEVYKEAELSKYSDAELKAELKRRKDGGL